jgi:hypothetical protein
MLDYKRVAIKLLKSSKNMRITDRRNQYRYDSGMIIYLAS